MALQRLPVESSILTACTSFHAKLWYAEISADTGYILLDPSPYHTSAN